MLLRLSANVTKHVAYLSWADIDGSHLERFAKTCLISRAHKSATNLTSKQAGPKLEKAVSQPKLGTALAFSTIFSIPNL